MALPKYKFVEEFVPERQKRANPPVSPKLMGTKNFGSKILHQIARCTYGKINIEGKEVYGEKMGEVGGWIESKNNLSQGGSCWVHPDAIVCGNATVSESAQIESGEVGDFSSVRGTAVIKGNVCLKGHARVGGSVELTDSVVVSDHAVVNGSCILSGDTEAKDDAVVNSSANITEEDEERLKDERYARSMMLLCVIKNSKISGSSRVFGETGMEDSVLEGAVTVRDAVLYDAKVKGNSTVKGYVEGPLEIEDTDLNTGIASTYTLMDYMNYVRNSGSDVPWKYFQASKKGTSRVWERFEALASNSYEG